MQKADAVQAHCRLHDVLLVEAMSYSGRVNSKKGSGGVAGASETNVHTKRRVKDLLATQVFDLNHDPYVVRTHLGSLECRLCLTLHTNETLYISHLGGRKHQRSLDIRRLLDEKALRSNHISQLGALVVSINNTPKREWSSMGRPLWTLTKIRDPDTFKLGLLLKVKCPKALAEPLFRVMSFYELSSRCQRQCRQYTSLPSGPDTEFFAKECAQRQYLVISAEPYENIAFAIPNQNEIDMPPQNTLASQEMNASYWWLWDKDIGEYFLQFLFKHSIEV